MDTEIRNAIDGVLALLEVEVLRLHLKLRRHTKTAERRLKALEIRAGIARIRPAALDGGK